MVRAFSKAGRQKVSRHPQSGRNRIYIVESPERRFIVKQILSDEGIAAECTANAMLRGCPFFSAPDYVLPRNGIFVYRHSESSRNLDELARSDSIQAIERIVRLSPQYFFTLHSVKVTDGQRLTRFVDSPILGDGVHFDFSPALKQLLRELQRRAVAGIRPFDSYAGPRQMSHGDLKLDNLIAVDGGTLIIDWELFCTAPLGWDLACLVGCAFIACTRHMGGGRDPSALRQADFADAVAAAWRMHALFNGCAVLSSSPPLSRPDLRWLVAHYLMERLCSEAAFKTELTRMDFVLVEVIDSLVRGNILEGE